MVKDKRTIIDINDFSGGLVTNIPITSLETKFTPDCTNVYGEGSKLRKRKGHVKVNTNTVAAGSVGNGMFNWVKSESEQLLMAVFGETVHKMDSVGSAWDGTFDAISAHSTSGTPWSNSITHFATYQGTLLFTNELRTHPQKMTATDDSHFNIESGGSGVAPNAKYIQIWKEHVWLLNISAGGLLSEDFASITDWTDDDTGTGASTQVTTDGLSALKMVGANAATASDAIRTRDIGNLSDDYIIEFKSNFGVLESVSAASTSTGYAHMHWDNGAIRLETRFSDDGLEVYDGAAWNEIGVSQVTESVWNTWKFVVTGGTATGATMDVIKDGTYIGVGLDISSASADTASDGEVKLTAFGSTAVGATWYMDYMEIDTSTAQKEYFADGDFSAWDDASTPTTPNLVAEPVQPLVHLKCNDSAGNSTVTNNGSDANNASSYAGATTTDTTAISNSSGKIGKSFTFSSASNEHIQLHATTVAAMSDDTAGTVCWWFNIDGDGEDNMLYMGDSANNRLLVRRTADNTLNSVWSKGGTEQWSHKTSAVTSGSFHHFLIVQDGVEPKFYVDGSLDSNALTVDTDKTQWFGASGTALDRCLISTSQTTATQPPLQGDIDDWRYYSSALSIDQIKSIYGDSNGTETQAVTARQGATFKIGTFAYEFTNDQTYAVGVTQTIASGSELAGVESVTGAWFFVTNSATYKIRVDDGVSNHDSAVLTGNGTWQYQVLEFTPDSGSTSLKWKCVSTSAATLYIDQVSVEAQNIVSINTKADRIQRSAVATLDNWDGTDSGNNDIITDKDIGLTGSFIINDRMYVTKKHSIHKFTYTGSTPLVDIKQVRSSIGTASPRSIKNVVIPGQGEVVIFLASDRRLYMFDGFDSLPIGNNIEFNNGISTTYLQNINTQALNKVFAIVHDDNPWYEIFLPMGTSTVPNKSIVYDYLNKSFWPMDNRNFRAGVESDNGAGQTVIYVQGNTSGFSYLTNSTNSDDGSSINGDWVSPKIGDSTILSRMDEVNLIGKSIGATPTLQWREDFNTTYVSNTLSSGTNVHNYNPRLLDNYIQFRVNDNSTNEGFELWNLRTLNKGIGHGK